MALVSMRQLLDHMPKTATVCPRSTSTTSNKCAPLWKPPTKSTRPSSYRRAQVRANTRARRFAPPDSGGSRRISAHPRRDAPRPRRIARRVPTLHPTGLLLRDDGRLFARRRQNPFFLRIQRQRHPYRRQLLHACGVSVERRNRRIGQPRNRRSRRRRRSGRGRQTLTRPNAHQR